jgi:hypothetical protein
MQRRDFVISTFVSVAGLSLPVSVAGQKKPIEPDLAALAENRNLNISVLKDGARKGIRLTNGVAYLPGIEFSNGAIELDLRGKDVQQQSFLGVAFHGLDDKTVDLIYFRPFNFRPDDAARRLRAVQYVSHPTYTWNVHPFAKNASPVTLGLVERGNWIGVKVISANKAFFHKGPNAQMKGRAYLVKHDPVRALKVQSGWVEAEYGADKVTRGWIKESDLSKSAEEYSIHSRRLGWR